MPRPPECDALIKLGSFKSAITNTGSIRQFLQSAEEMVAATEHPMADSARFLLAYEGMFSVVMAVLEFHDTARR